MEKILRGRQCFKVSQKMLDLLLGGAIWEVFIDEKMVKVGLEKWRENSLNLFEVFILILIKWNVFSRLERIQTNMILQWLNFNSSWMFLILGIEIIYFYLGSYSIIVEGLFSYCWENDACQRICPIFRELISERYVSCP